MQKEGVERGVSAGDDLAGDGLDESVGIESFMTEMSPKVANQYFNLVCHLLKFVPENFSGLKPLK